MASKYQLILAIVLTISGLSACSSDEKPKPEVMVAECIAPKFEKDYTLSRKFEAQLDAYEKYEICMMIEEWKADHPDVK